MHYPENSYTYKEYNHGYTVIILTLPDGSKLFHCEDGPTVIFKYGGTAWWFWNKYYGGSGSGYNQKLFEKHIKLRAFR